MAGVTKKMKIRRESLPGKEMYSLEEAMDSLQAACNAAPRNFDETVECAYRLGIDPRKAEQQLRGTFVLPHGTGRQPKIAVFAKGEKMVEAEEAGADFVGGEEMADRVQKEGWVGFDVAISTPDMMRVVGKLGKVLGPRGLMPNPKSGTVTFDLKETIDEFKKGKLEYRNDSFGIIAVPIGRISFQPDQLIENFMMLHNTIIRARPSSAKGMYIKSIAISSTMGPGLRIDPASLVK